ncbi:MAG: DUF1850 domain-containing protein [Acidaminobacter sp.]|uniref:DUF1850 domain-containing protein n=1 Tax=Acidaminobacter sp. TaxID=1872102 RepID=UPI001380E4F3|nr:DUF1850 domain-containing protein [Acidaminobacter sp.]MZQ99151.1 DUF1850 domain-containing protein [Acidaminobacter sp.]
MKNKESSNAIVWSIESDAGKSHLTSLHRKGLIILGAIVSLLLLIGALLYLNQPVLIIYNQQTGEKFATLPVEAGDVLEYNWIHSFEHIPWNERYRIQADHGLLLVEIHVAGFGAGIPENKGITSVENGIVVMRDLDERFEYISWIHSNTALSSIVLNGQKVASGPDLPHHQPLKLEVKRRLNTWLVNR